VQKVLFLLAIKTSFFSCCCFWKASKQRAMRKTSSETRACANSLGLSHLIWDLVWNKTRQFVKFGWLIWLTFFGVGRQLPLHTFRSAFFCAFTYGTRFSLPRVPFKRRKHVLRVSLEPKSQGNEGLHSNIHCLLGVGPLPCWLPVADCQHLQWRATCLAGIGPGNWRFPRNPKALSKCVISPIL